jgi:hypothetical protein
MAGRSRVGIACGSQNPDGPMLIISAVGWRDFTGNVKVGEYDLTWTAR